GADGLIGVNIGGAFPTQLAKVTLGEHVHSCDFSGNVLVAASKERGEVYDISNPASPNRMCALGVGRDWVSAGKRVGNRAAICAGPNLLVFDVSNPFGTHVIGNAPLGDWGMGLDVAGNICVVATDGSGLAIFDISGVPPAPVGNNKDALRCFNVRIQ